MDGFAAKTAGFLTWLSDSQVSVSRKITIQDLRAKNAGRGVVASQNIDVDEVLFTVPRTSILCASNSELPDRIPEAFRELDPWSAIILVMLYEYGKGASSRWKAYFDVLPKSFDTLMFWNEEELAELQASAVRHKIGKDSANDSFRETILPVMQRMASVFPACQDSSETELLALAHRMGTLVMAYAFDIEKPEVQKEFDEEGYALEEEDEDLPKGMVPLADILNADADRNNARLFYEEETLVMKALKPIQAGEEVFNDYGPLPRSDLLRRYGYTTVNYAKYDVVEIPHELIVNTLKETRNLADDDLAERLTYLDEQGVIDEGYDISHPEPGESLQECFSPEILTVVSALLMSKPDFNRMKSSAKLPKIGLMSDLLAQSLFRLVETRKAEYGTTLEEDEELLRHRQDGVAVNHTGRFRMALEVRAGEKAVLQDAENVLRQLLLNATGSTQKRRALSDEDNINKRAKAA